MLKVEVKVMEWMHGKRSQQTYGEKNTPEPNMFQYEN